MIMDTGSLASAETPRLVVAARQFLSVMEKLQAEGDTVVTRVTERKPAIHEWEQFPEREQEDSNSGFRYYYHSHACPGASREHGHFHLFKRIANGDSPDAFTHLLAIGVDLSGLPVRLFSTNVWVTGETVVPANEVKRLADAFTVERDDRMVLVAEWIEKVLALFASEIDELLVKRDLRRSTLASQRHFFERDRRTIRIAEIVVDPLKKMNDIDSLTGQNGVH